MKIGDLAEYKTNPYFWGIVVGIDSSQYEVYWQDGGRSWIVKTVMREKQQRTENVLDFFHQ